MPYTRPWEQVLNLLGTRQSAEIDNASREETKVDLTERFSDILEDVEADPWRLKVPPATGLETRYFWTAGDVRPVSGAPFVIVGPNYVYSSVNSSVMAVWMPIIVPVGYRFKEASFRWSRDTGASIGASVFRTQADGTTINLIDTASIPIIFVGGGWRQDSAAGDCDVLAGESMFAYVEMTNGAAGERARFMDMGVILEPLVP